MRPPNRDALSDHQHRTRGQVQDCGLLGRPRRVCDEGPISLGVFLDRSAQRKRPNNRRCPAICGDAPSAPGNLLVRCQARRTWRDCWKKRRNGGANQPTCLRLRVRFLFWASLRCENRAPPPTHLCSGSRTDNRHTSPGGPYGSSIRQGRGPQGRFSTIDSLISHQSPRKTASMLLPSGSRINAA